MFIGTNSGEEKARLQRNPHIFNDPHASPSNRDASPLLMKMKKGK
jgi:hypothetical protein